MNLRIRVDDAQTARGLARAAGRIDTQARKGIRVALRETVEPHARRVAPHKTGRLAARTRAGATSRGAYLTQKTPYAGLIEFGGTRRDIIRPRNKRALTTPAGPRAIVRAPRTYKPSGKLRQAVNDTRATVAETSLALILDAYDEYFTVQRGGVIRGR